MEENGNKYTFNVTVQPGGTNINVVENYNASQQSAHRFPMCLEDRKLNMLYSFLVSKTMISPATLSNNFCYMMGGTETPTKIEPIEWIGNLQELREMLLGAFSDLIERQALKMADIEKIVPFCFKKDGKPLTLAKNDTRKSTGIIAFFFEKLATM